MQYHELMKKKPLSRSQVIEVVDEDSRYNGSYQWSDQAGSWIRLKPDAEKKGGKQTGGKTPEQPKTPVSPPKNPPTASSKSKTPSLAPSGPPTESPKVEILPPAPAPEPSKEEPTIETPPATETPKSEVQVLDDTQAATVPFASGGPATDALVKSPGVHPTSPAPVQSTPANPPTAANTAPTTPQHTPPKPIQQGQPIHPRPQIARPGMPNRGGF